VDDGTRLSPEQERALKATALGVVLGLVLAVMARRRA